MPREPIRAIRVPDELWQAALAKAQANNESLSEVIRQALARYLRSRR